MEKRGIIAPLFVSAAGLASAYGSYSSFSLGNLLDSFDPSTLILGLLFIIFLVLTKFALSRVMRDSDGPVNVLAFCFSLGAIYGIHRMGWDYQNFFYDLGLNNDILYLLVPILLIIGLFYISKSRKEGGFLFYRVFLLVGALLAAISFTDLIYEKGLLLTIGIVLFLFGLWLRHRHRRKFGGYSPSVPNSYRTRGSIFKMPQRYHDWKNYRKQVKDQHRMNDLKDIDRQREIQRQQQAAQQQAAQQQAQQIQKVRIRSLNDLKQKYMSYLFAYYRKGFSPQQQMRMKQALVTIIKMANQQGCDTGTFLSSKIGGSNAKSPNELG